MSAWARGWPSGSLLRGLGAVIAAFVLSACFDVASAGGDSRSLPLVSIRADHMVLDIALRGDQLLVATQSGRVDVYDGLTGDVLPSLYSEPELDDRPFTPTVRSLAISPDGTELSVVTSDGLLHRQALGTEGVLTRAQPLGVTAVPGLMLVRYLDGPRLLLADMRGELALLDTLSGDEVYRRQLDYDPIFAMDLSPDRSQLALAFRSSRVQIVSPATGETTRVLKGHLDSVFALEWRGDHKLVTAGKDKQMFEWDLRETDPKPRSLYRGDHYITALGIDQAGDRLAFPVDEHAVAFIELASGRIEERRLEGHTAPVQKLVFIDAGQKLISAGYDARVFVWNLDSEREPNVRR